MVELGWRSRKRRLEGGVELDVNTAKMTRQNDLRLDIWGLPQGILYDILLQDIDLGPQMNKHIFIDIRYSLYAPALRNSWKIGRESEESYKKDLFSAERMQRRQFFFEKVTLKSLISLNQNKPIDVSLKVNVLTSDLLPERNANFLRDVAKNNDFINIVYFSEGDVDIRAPLMQQVNDLGDSDIYASVRLDDDDGLSKDFAKQLSFYLHPKFSGTVVSFAKGYGGLLDEVGDFLSVAEYKWRFGSAGLTYISEKSKSVRTGSYSIYQCGDHTKTDNKFPTISDGRSASFLRAFHLENDSKDSFQKCVGKIISPDDLEAALTTFF
jgi:hypothetical protein